MPSQRSAKPEKKTVALLGIAEHATEALRFLPIGLYGVWNWRGTVGKNK